MNEAITTARNPQTRLAFRPKARPVVVYPTVWRQHLAAALASAALLWLSYFPVAWSPLAWIALVPLLSLVRSNGRPRTIYLSAWLCGLAFFWPVLQWMRVADYRMYYTWGALATYCSLYVPLAIFLIRRLDRGTALPLVVSVPVVWAALEYCRSFLLTGFAWYFLGHSQHDFLALIQVTDLGGVYLVSMLIAAFNALVFELFLRLSATGFWPSATNSRLSAAERRKPIAGSRPPEGTAWPWLITQAVALGLLLTATLIYGRWRLAQAADFQPGPLVALLQSNIDQRLRNLDPSSTPAEAKEAQGKVMNQYGLLVKNARTTIPKPQLIVWPETSIPHYWLATAPSLDASELPSAWVKVQRDTEKIYHQVFVQQSGIDNLFGVQARVLENPHKKALEKYNSALLMRADGTVAGRYDKIHRVPFGEYVPFLDWLPFMRNFAPSEYAPDYSIRAGEAYTRLAWGKYHFGVVICYEDTDPYLARQYVRADEHGPAVDFMINISNDGWFDGTSEHEEHLAICRFRAIECRRAVARSVNMGISAVIDGNGRVWAAESVGTHEGIQRWATYGTRDGRIPDLPVSEWHHFKKVPGVLTAVIPLDSRTSLYALLGDWLPQLCWVVVILALAWAICCRFRRASHRDAILV